jgi:hypothetical protein
MATYQIKPWTSKTSCLANPEILRQPAPTTMKRASHQIRHQGQSNTGGGKRGGIVFTAPSPFRTENTDHATVRARLAASQEWTS